MMSEAHCDVETLKLFVLQRCRIAGGAPLGLGMGLPRNCLSPAWGSPSLSSQRPA